MRKINVEKRKCRTITEQTFTKRWFLRIERGVRGRDGDDDDDDDEGYEETGRGERERKKKNAPTSTIEKRYLIPLMSGTSNELFFFFRASGGQLFQFFSDSDIKAENP